MHVTSGAPVPIHAVTRGSHAMRPRILTDRGLLRQIRAELTCRAMGVAEIAQLEDVTPELLLRVIEAGLSPADDPSWKLRAYARRNPGFQTAAWLTSRGRLTRRHIINPDGAALCGIPLGPERELLDGGPCRTCLERGGLIG